jgi:hypothetical protein
MINGASCIWDLWHIHCLSKLFLLQIHFAFKEFLYIGFEVLRTVAMRCCIFWDITPLALTRRHGVSSQETEPLNWCITLSHCISRVEIEALQNLSLSLSIRLGWTRFGWCANSLERNFYDFMFETGLLQISCRAQDNRGRNKQFGLPVTLYVCILQDYPAFWLSFPNFSPVLQGRYQDKYLHAGCNRLLPHTYVFIIHNSLTISYSATYSSSRNWMTKEMEYNLRRH